MGLLISKANEKSQTIVTINNLGIYYQELRLKDRPMSPRVKIGCLAIVKDEDGKDSVMATYEPIAELDALISERNSLEKALASPINTDKIIAIKSELDSLKSNLDSLMNIVSLFKGTNRYYHAHAVSLTLSAIADKEKQLEVLHKDTLVEKLKAIETAIASNPIHKLESFNAKAMQAIDALVDKARTRHQQGKFNGEFIGFTHYPTKEFFYEQEARALLKRHNEALSAKGIEDGYMNFNAAMAIVGRRFALSDDMAKKANAANPLLKKGKA